MIETVEVPTSAEAVVTTLGGGRSAVLAGGTILMATVNNESTDLATLVSTRRIGNRSIDIADGRARIGAAATLADVHRHAGLACLHPVVASIGSPTIRNMATVGGNLFARSPYGDLAVALIALDATADVLSSTGTRTASVESIVNDGVATAELVTSVAFAMPASNGWFYTKAMRRKLNSASIVTIAASLTTDQGTVTDARVALGGCGPIARRSPGAESALTGAALDEASVAEAAAAASSEADFVTDEYASAWYRARVLPVHFRRALLGDDTQEGVR